MGERTMWGVQEDTRRRDTTEGGMIFHKRRIMEENPINVGGRIVRRWTGWYYVEAYDSFNGKPYGKYLCPPTYDDFAGLYQSTTINSFAEALTENRDVGEDVPMYLRQQQYR